MASQMWTISSRKRAGRRSGIRWGNGSAEDVAALSPHQLSIHMTYTGLPQPTMLRSLELFGTRVLPRLREPAFA